MWCQVVPIKELRQMTKIIETRRDAIQALKRYIDALKDQDYNETCIRDCVVVTALDALECYGKV